MSTESPAERPLPPEPLPVRRAPEWVRKQREALRKMPPPTLEKVRAYFHASAEHSFRNSPYYKPGKKKDGKPKFFPVWSTHQTASEGGRKTHLVEASHIDRVRSAIKALCKRRIPLANTGDPIPDVEAWAKGSPNEVCKLCYYRATNRMPVRGLMKGPFNE
jgi:hypothetical protein